jgi:carboxyl-terminal processing protease
LIIGLTAIGLLRAKAQNTHIDYDPSPIVRAMMDKFHCSPPKSEDVLIHRIITNLVHTIDPGHLYLTRPDVDTIYDRADMLKDELKGRETRFLSKLLDMYRNRLARADSGVSALMLRPLDYSLKEFAVMKDTTWAATTADLRKKWEQALKYECLHQLSTIALDSASTPASAMKKEPQIREKVLKSILRRIRRPQTYPAGFEAYLTEDLANAICKSYDPHSDYFTRSGKENFDGAVTGASYLFGFDIDDNEHEEVCIRRILPGSPAWRSGGLNKGDVIISMRWAGQDAMDLSGADADDVSRLLDDQNHKDIEIGVRKADGTTKLVWLEKQKIEVEDGFVKSYVLDGGGTRVGYIVLPGFYEESEGENAGKSCASDVAREVIKLKGENIQSIILDLRNNGGGSMNEAMQLAGIFIDEGILAFARYKGEKPMSFRDPNRGTIYDGPMIVMVNKASASASEMVAGALQDYNRALIVGSPTFGKATMQIVLPMDTFIELGSYSERAYHGKPTEFVKVTLGRFYRVTGSTHQLRGVQPDIYLPDLTEAAGYGEKSERYPLAPDSVKRASYYNPLPPMPINELSAQSHQRTDTSEAFRVVGRYIEFAKKALKAYKEPIPLQYDEYLDFTKQYRLKAKALEKEYKDIKHTGAYKTKDLSADADRIKPDQYMADELKNTKENIDKDIYIQECFSIITNYLKLNKK